MESYHIPTANTKDVERSSVDLFSAMYHLGPSWTTLDRDLEQIVNLPSGKPSCTVTSCSLSPLEDFPYRFPYPAAIHNLWPRNWFQEDAAC
ncbi:hypothetical protein EVAR_50689_1 [Eumeta japonica]|uniref:Uncharacterized protein n=1 Tax=Eumeta variegata TaxID=151549 RepID=A0A4C1XS11_EUMVA|nr:hypothetical protein EVAR_50689_1 [Eumeta japonica]